MDASASLRRFVLDYLAEIGAEIRDEDGIHAILFPTGFRRRYGRERRITFDPERRREQVELVEAGSPFLKMLLTDAKAWGALSVYPTEAYPAGSRLYTFQLEAYSSAKKRTRFVWALLEAGHDEPAVREGIPPIFDAAPADASRATGDLGELRAGLDAVLPAVEGAGRTFAQEAVAESRDAFAKAMERVGDYFKSLHQDTHLEEARIRKRLGEIQSKLYFTEDGLRELKLQREQERLTEELHALKKRNTQASESMQGERAKQAELLRRRHEPKLRIRLVAATVCRAPKAPPRREPPAAAQPPAAPDAMPP
jgi:hypothetical protein